MAFRHPAGCGSHWGLGKASAPGSHRRGTEVGGHPRRQRTEMSRNWRTKHRALNTGCPPRRSAGSSQAPTDRHRGQPCIAVLQRLSWAERLPYERASSVGTEPTEATPLRSTRCRTSPWLSGSATSRRRRGRGVTTSNGSHPRRGTVAETDRHGLVRPERRDVHRLRANAAESAGARNRG